MLKSLCACAKCGKAVTMWQKTSATTGRRDAWYKCSYRDPAHGHHLCEGGRRSVRADVLEGAIWSAWVNSLTVELQDRIDAYYDDLRSEAGDADAEMLKAQRAKLVKTRQAAMA
jgi:hypothetical protein